MNLYSHLFDRSRSLHWQNRCDISSSIFFSPSLISSLSLAQVIAGHIGCVNTCHFSHDGSLAITGSDDMSIQLHNIYSNQLQLKIETPHRGNIFDIQEILTTNSCNQFLSCAGDGRVIMTKIAENGTKTFSLLKRHRGRSHKIKFIPNDSNVVISCGEDGLCYLFDLREPHSLSFDSAALDFTRKNTIEYRNELGHKRPIYSIDINPQQPFHIAVGGEASSANVYDTRFLSLSESLTAPVASYYGNCEIDHNVCGLQYHQNGKELLVSHNYDHIYRYDLNRHNRIENNQFESSKPYLTVYKGHRNFETIKQVTYMSNNRSISFSGSSPDRDYVLSGSDEGHIFIWDRDTGSLAKVLIGSLSSPVNCVTPHPDYPLIATCGIERTVKLWFPRGENAWVGKTFASVASDRNEADRIANEEKKESMERDLEKEYLLMLTQRGELCYDDENSDNDHTASSESSLSSGENTSDEDVADDQDEVNEDKSNLFTRSIQGSDIPDHLLGNFQDQENEVELPESVDISPNVESSRRRTHSEIDTGESEDNLREEERRRRLRRYLMDKYDELYEFDRTARRREGVPEDSDSEIYFEDYSDQIGESSGENESEQSDESISSESELLVPEEISVAIERDDSPGTVEYEDVD